MATNTTKAVRPRLPALGTALALLATVLAWTAASPPAPVQASGETIISTFYVPLFEDNARAALFAVNNATASQLSSTTSITIAATGAIVYYDQWEDGYEAAANVKTQTSTLVFGDGNTANGDGATYCVVPRCAGDLLPAGAVLRLNNSATVVPGPITVPRTTGTVVFDGRDKISSTDGLAVTHATWPTAIDALHSEMAAAFDTSRWGVNFVAPVGIDTPVQGSGTTSFDYTGIEVMAREAGTQVFIDLNHNGSYADAGDVNGTTIGEGQTVYVNGNVPQGAKIVASKAVQVFMMTGHITSNYENRSFQIFPTEGLVNDYIAPASAAKVSGTPSYATVLYLFNPQTTAITVTVQTSAGSTNYSIAAGSVLNPAPVLANGQAARVTSASTFAALAGIGTREVTGSSKDYDWGYSLLPARVITDSLVAGWAPGSQDLTNATYDPVWVTTLQPTTLYVDYDADPTTGANVDPNGGFYDTSIVVATALSQVRITDATDKDMTGARIYTTDGTAVAAAYGEDPGTAPVAFPGVDLGTTMFPACGAMCVRKLATISIDVDGDGLVDAGDTLHWSVEAANTDYYALLNPVLFDTLPSGLTYVPGSTSVSVNGGAFSAVADDVVPPAASLFPYDGGGRQINATVVVGGTVLATFDTIVDPTFAGTSAICNRAVVTSQREIILTPANGADSACLAVDGLRLTKTSNSGGNPVVAGQALAYTLTVTNQSAATMSNIVATDPLPSGLTWVSTSVTRPAAAAITIADNFETAGSWAGSSGSTAWSATNWSEVDATGVGTGTGHIQKVADGDTSAEFLNGSALNDTISRIAGDLSAYSTVTLSLEKKCTGLENNDIVLLQIRPNVAGAWTTLSTYTLCNDAAYVAQSFPLTAGQWGTATEIRFQVTDPFGGSNPDNLFIDNVQFSASGRIVSTVAGAAPTPGPLVTLTDLLPGESATIVVNTTVNNPYTATDEVTNIATVRTGNQVAKASVIDCVRCFDYSDDPSTYNGAGGLSPARARATSPRTYIGDTFQTGGYTGSTGTATWAGTTWVEAGDDASATAGLIQNVVDVSTRSIRIGSATVVTPLNTALSRVLGDLSSYTSANLAFDYRCSNLTVGDQVQLQIRPTAAAGWTTLQTFDTCNNATVYSNGDLTLGAGTFGTATEVRAIVTNAFTANVFFFLDDIQIRATADTQTVGPRLGSVVDREVQGAGGAAPAPATAPAAPTGDDTAGSDDEDGVVVPAVDVNTMDIPITVTDTSGGVSYVNGWFDWSNDGTFQAGESLFDPARFVSATGGLTVVGGVGQVPAPGTYTVTVSVPDLDTNGSGYTIGSTVYSRFRVATLRTDVSAATGASADGEVEDYSTTLNTLPVDVSYLGSMRGRGNDVEVRWRTAQEVDNLGFNLFSEDPDGTRTLLTPDLVLSKAPTSVDAQDYAITVTTTANMLWLEDVALDGTSEIHGPYTLGEEYGRAKDADPIDWAAAHAEVDSKLASERREELRRAQKESKERTASPQDAPVGPVAKLSVTEAGVQLVTYEQLVAAGVDLVGVPAASLAVTDVNGPLPIEIVGAAAFGPGSAIRFIGEPLDTIYTGTNVYRLHIDPSLALRVATVTAPPVESTTTTSTSSPAPPTTIRGRRRTDVTVENNDVATQDVKVPTADADASTPDVVDPAQDGKVLTDDGGVSTQDVHVESRGGGRPTPTSSTTSTTTTTIAPTTTLAPPVVPAASYAATVVAEENLAYSVSAPGADPWFERMLVSVPGTPATGSTTVTLTDPVAGQPAHVAVELWGITRDPVLDDHHAQLWVNGVLAADARFDDNDALQLEGSVPAGVLTEGANTLEVRMLDDTGVDVDMVAINSWKVVYQRALVAVDGRLDLTVAADRLDVSGMPAEPILAYAVAADGSVTKLDSAVAGDVVQVPGTGASMRYVLNAASAVRSPAVSPARPAADLMTGSADYLIITNGIFTNALAPLIAYHESQGRTVKVVDVADVYERYSGGNTDAGAIDRYLAEAVSGLGVHWVLLVGADSVDYRDYDHDGSFSLMPSQYGTTGFGITYAPIDPAYADTDGDDVPDVALGRLPARTPAELSMMIGKTLAYAGRSSSRSLLMVSGASEAAGGIDYAAANDAIAAQFDGWDVQRADEDRQGLDGAHAELMAALNDGVAVTFYLGHSGTQEWSEVGLFDAASAETLTNSVPTMVVQFGCWNTYYVAPDADTLAHGLMLDPNGGAAAVLGSTTLTSSANDIQLAGFLAGFLAAGGTTVGDAVLAAKAALQQNAGGATSDVQLGWTILGDPAMPVGGVA